MQENKATLFICFRYYATVTQVINLCHFDDQYEKKPTSR